MTYNRDRITYPAADGKNTVVAYVYTPAEGEVDAVLQLCHGMCEYILRYEPLVEYLCAHGIAFAGNDHTGHGETAACAADLGYTSGAENMIRDTRFLTQTAAYTAIEAQRVYLGSENIAVRRRKTYRLWR